MNKEVQNPEVKFNAHARVLAQALKRLQPVAKNGSVLPIVNGNVHVGLTGNTATLSATDLETRVSVTIAVQNTTPNPAAPQPIDTLSDGESYGALPMPDDDLQSMEDQPETDDELVFEPKSRYERKRKTQKGKSEEPAEQVEAAIAEEEQPMPDDVEEDYQPESEEYIEDIEGEENPVIAPARIDAFEAPAYDYQFLLPIDMLPILESLDGLVSVAYANGIVYLSAAGGCWQFLSNSTEDYPTRYKVFNATTILHVNAAVLAATIRAISFACSEDKMRPAMMFVYVDTADAVEKNAVTLVATNGHVLLTKKLDCFANANGGSFLLPKAIARFIAGLEGDVELCYDESICEWVIVGKNIEVKGRSEDARYPDYKVVIPAADQPATKVSVSKRALIAALKRAKFLTDPVTKELDFHFEQGIVHLAADNLETGVRAMDETLLGKVDLKTPEEPEEVRLNAQLFLDVISNFGSDETASFLVYAPNRPVIYQLGATDDIALIMPLLKPN